MAHESSRSSDSKVLLNEARPLSPLIRAAHLKGKGFGQSVVDFDLDEEDYCSEYLIIWVYYVMILGC